MTSTTNARRPVHALTAVALSALTFWGVAACTASASFGGADQPTAAPPPPPPPPAPTDTAPAATATATATTTATTPPPAEPRKSTVSVKSESIVVPGVIEFDEGTTALKSTSEAALQELRLFLEQNPRVTKLRIEGYTDNAGKAEDNENLSGMRALTIKKWLIANGVAAERLIAVGFGQNKPIADNATAEGRAKNRRIEFKLAELGGKKYLNRPLDGGGKVFD